MQCFWVGYCSMVSHEKALHNYFIPCLNLQKTYGNLGRARKSQRISKNFGNTSNPFLSSLNDLWNFWKTSETVQIKVFSRCFYDIFKIFGKSSEIFRSVWKYSEICGKLWKRFKSNFQMFLWFFKIFGKTFRNLQKCSEIFRNFQMWSEMFVTVHRS